MSPVFDTYPAPVDVDGARFLPRVRSILYDMDGAHRFVAFDDDRATRMDVVLTGWSFASRSGVNPEGQTVSVGPTVGCGCGATLKTVPAAELLALADAVLV